MAIRIPSLGTGSGAVGDGDNELKIRQDYNHNFSDQSNAASRLVGPAAGNVMEVGAFGLGLGADGRGGAQTPERYIGKGLSLELNEFWTGNYCATLNMFPYVDLSALVSFCRIQANSSGDLYIQGAASATEWGLRRQVWTTANATKDPNGFLKGASPIAEIYSDTMDLNQDATEQGGITFEKLAVGDYLVKGSLGFAREGWYIETPKDANGNVLVAVVYEQRANNDISIKTYAKKFDDETGDIVANLLKPRDIPVGRFISLRLHELPKEPPVMPTETQPEV